MMFNGTVAIIGTGFMGPTHTEALRRLGIHIGGILDATPERSRRAAETMGLPKGYASLEELLADPEVHAVHIATPNMLHYSMAKAVLEAGKHVLCEKPLAMTSAESADLVRIAASSGCVAGVNYNMRFYPLNIEARERVRRGDIGDVYTIHGSYIQDWLLYETDYNWRVLASVGGNVRAIGDIGTHWMDLAQSISGLEIEAVCADLQTVHPVRLRPQGEVQTFTGKLGAPQATEPIAITTEDTGSVLLRFKGGARGVLHVSQVNAGRKNNLRWEIAGSKGALAWDGEHPNELWLGARERANEVLLKDPSLLSPTARSYAAYPGNHAEGYPDTFKMIFKAFYGYIEAGDFSLPAPFPTFAEGHREMLLCEAIFKSHNEQRWVHVE
jgi:predicted dehydrogenase